MKKITITFGMVVIGAFLVFWIMLLSGNIFWASNTPPLQVIDDMDDQQKVKPQQESHFFADRAGSRAPIQYTVPRNGTIYNITLQEADDLNKNPFVAAQYQEPQIKNFILARGANRFNTFCYPCHNYDAKGNGPVVAKGMPNPPDLTRPDAVAYTDGKFFHIISAGQNVMSSYADKLPVEDRWAVVEYIRAIQRGQVSPKAPAYMNQQKAELNQTSPQSLAQKAQ